MYRQSTTFPPIGAQSSPRQRDFHVLIAVTGAILATVRPRNTAERSTSTFQAPPFPRSRLIRPNSPPSRGINSARSLLRALRRLRDNPRKFSSKRDKLREYRIRGAACASTRPIVIPQIAGTQAPKPCSLCVKRGGSVTN